MQFSISKNILTFSLLFAIIGQFFDGVFGSPSGSLVNVEGYLDNYVAYKYEGHLELAKQQLGQVSPPTAAILNLTAVLGNVEPKLGADDPKNKQLLAKAQQMFFPLKDSRNKLFEIKHKIGTVGYYENSPAEDEQFIQDTFKLFGANQQKLVQEAKQKNYKFLEAALAQLGKAIVEFKAKHVPFSVHYGPGNDCQECKQIERLATNAAEVGLRQVFGLYGAKEN